MATVSTSKRNARVVPWASHTEWEQTYHWLYSHQIEGVRRVRGWSSRGKVPQAVDSTAMFVEIWLRDRSGTCSEHELRLMYSIAFVRFVNGVVDSQQKGIYAGSVAGIAESLGLPAWFVDLRHSGTHDRLPSISLLRSGCHQALDWLNANYWIVQTTYVNNTASDVQELLIQYTEATKQGDTKAATTAIKEIVSVIIADNYRDFLIPVLVSPGFLVPESKKTRSKYTDLTLHPEVQNLWNDPINSFEAAWPGFIEDVLLAIIATFVDPSKTPEAVCLDSTNSILYSMSFQSTLASWAKHILKTKVFTNPAATTKPQAGDDENSTLDNIVEACLGNPNIFSKHLMTDISSFNTDFADYLKPFIAFVDDSFKSAILAENTTQKKRKQKVDSSHIDSATLSAELALLQSRLKEIQTDNGIPTSIPSLAAISSTSGNQFSPWKLSTDLSWHRVPLGHIPSVGLPSLDLSVEVDHPESGVVNIPILENLDGNGMFEIRELEEVNDDDQENDDIKEAAIPKTCGDGKVGLNNVDVKQVAKKVRIL
ncbi:UNVERIFIED_CONTAM: Ribosomal biogenesis protein las1l [Siphonaria sp. JEL0065]|nr:Ribosomal biogenesis protein las1l [Siphonaria sp. JEL0065]